VFGCTSANRTIIPKASLPQRTRKDSTPQRKSVSLQGRKPPPAALDTRALGVECSHNGTFSVFRKEFEICRLK